ncbi:MAG: MFS transporter [Gammaproteobacteria bacterium]|nr:MFS transporter [Gammaproteobacteria bacterium]
MVPPAKYLTILSLIIAGEMIFSLPFHIARYFRPTLLEVFSLSNSDLGDVFAVYGITAMLAYFPGGIIADQFSARKLITLSLFATAAGGLYMAQQPGITGLTALFGYWGITSILLFWAPLIRATRDWGGVLSQGKAFGLLDGGRGFVAAIFASLGVIIFTWLLPETVSTLDDLQRNRGMQHVIYYYSLMTAMSGVLTWYVIPETSKPSLELESPMKKVKDTSRHIAIWLLAAVVVCAYCGYKGLDNYGLYAVEVLGMSEIESARFTSMAAYIRPIAAIAAGIIADRITSSKLISICFIALIISYFALSIVGPGNISNMVIYLNLVVTFVAVFAIRGVYFALIEEFGFPETGTGTAVGIISVVGFTPDIFFAPMAGRILDASPGIQGHQHYFLMLTAIAVCGMVTAAGLIRTKNRTARH